MSKNDPIVDGGVFLDPRLSAMLVGLSKDKMTDTFAKAVHQAFQRDAELSKIGNIMSFASVMGMMLLLDKDAQLTPVERTGAQFGLIYAREELIRMGKNVLFGRDYTVQSMLKEGGALHGIDDPTVIMATIVSQKAADAIERSAFNVHPLDEYCFNTQGTDGAPVMEIDWSKKKAKDVEGFFTVQNSKDGDKALVQAARAHLVIDFCDGELTKIDYMSGAKMDAIKELRESGMLKPTVTGRHGPVFTRQWPASKYAVTEELNAATVLGANNEHLPLHQRITDILDQMINPKFMQSPHPDGVMIPKVAAMFKSAGKNPDGTTIWEPVGEPHIFNLVSTNAEGEVTVTEIVDAECKDITPPPPSTGNVIDAAATMTLGLAAASDSLAQTIADTYKLPDGLSFPIARNKCKQASGKYTCYRCGKTTLTKKDTREYNAAQLPKTVPVDAEGLEDSNRWHKSWVCGECAAELKEGRDAVIAKHKDNPAAPATATPADKASQDKAIAAATTEAETAEKAVKDAENLVTRRKTELDLLEQQSATYKETFKDEDLPAPYVKMQADAVFNLQQAEDGVTAMMENFMKASDKLNALTNGTAKATTNQCRKLS